MLKVLPRESSVVRTLAGLKLYSPRDLNRNERQLFHELDCAFVVLLKRDEAQEKEP